MQLEDYFDFVTPNDIQIKGHRIGIETVLFDYIHRGRLPEEIVRSYPSLSLEQVYATILYYLHNIETVTAYLEEWLESTRRAQEEQERNPPPFVSRLRALRKQMDGEKRQTETASTTATSVEASAL